MCRTPMVLLQRACGSWAPVPTIVMFKGEGGGMGIEKSGDVHTCVTAPAPNKGLLRGFDPPWTCKQYGLDMWKPEMRAGLHSCKTKLHKVVTDRMRN